MQRLRNTCADGKYIAAVIAGALLLLGLPGAALALTGAGNSTIKVMVCPTGSESSLSITAPASDSVIGDSQVITRGTVENISQIDFYLDDTYNNTIALDYGATSFSSVISLQAGTHTIRLVAYDSCHQTTHTASVVLTYEPSVALPVPEQAAHGDPQLPPSAKVPQKARGLVSYDKLTVGKSPAQVAAPPVPSPLISRVSDVARKIGVSLSPQAQGAVNVAKTSAVLAATVAIAFPQATLLYAGQFAQKFLYSIFGISSVATPPKRLGLVGKVSLRVLGVGLLLAAFLF